MSDWRFSRIYGWLIHAESTTLDHNYRCHEWIQTDDAAVVFGGFHVRKLVIRSPQPGESSVTGDVPELTGQYARENEEQLEYIDRHRSSIGIRDYAAALLIRGPSVRTLTTSSTNSKRTGK